MRPKKKRRIKCLPSERCFRPECKNDCEQEINLLLEEFEAVRLADLEELTHAKAAKLMNISRPTFTRILSAARMKIADGLVNIKPIRIKGGCCTVKARKKS